MLELWRFVVSTYIGILILPRYYYNRTSRRLIMIVDESHSRELLLCFGSVTHGHSGDHIFIFVNRLLTVTLHDFIEITFL